VIRPYGYDLEIMHWTAKKPSDQNVRWSDER